MRRLVLNADDFGLTPGVNRAIGEAHERGLVTSTTLMANSPAFDHAVNVAREHPRLSVGCHVMLVDGEPLLPREQVRTLLAGGVRFRQGIAGFALAAVRGLLDAQEIEAEATAQIRKLQSAGVRVTHVDTHKHTHMFPQILRPLLRAAAACGVRAVRNPFAPVRPLAWAHLLRRPRLWTRYTEVRVLRGFARAFRHAVAEAGMVTTDGSFGVVVTGALDQRLFDAIIGSLPEGTWEFVCHPGYCDDELRRVPTRLRESRACELEVLVSAAAREAISRRGVQLISYRELLAGETLNPAPGADIQSGQQSAYRP